MTTGDGFDDPVGDRVVHPWCWRRMRSVGTCRAVGPCRCGWAWDRGWDGVEPLVSGGVGRRVAERGGGDGVVVVGVAVECGCDGPVVVGQGDDRWRRVHGGHWPAGELEQRLPGQALLVQSSGAVTAQLVRVVAGTETVIQSVARCRVWPWRRVTAAGPVPGQRDGDDEPGGQGVGSQVRRNRRRGCCRRLIGPRRCRRQRSGCGPTCRARRPTPGGPVGRRPRRPTGRRTPPPANVAPVASFSASSSGLVASVDGSCVERRRWFGAVSYAELG